MNRFSKASAIALFFVTAAALNLFVYGPTLNRPFVDIDQVWYLAERELTPSFWEGVGHAISRHYWKGDDFVFRPLFFVWLAVLYHFFSYHFYFWNLAHLLLHTLTITSLGLLLWRIQRGVFAPLTALAVSCLPGLFDLVMLHHAGGHFWGFNFFLPALGIVWEMMREREASKRQILSYVVLMTVACFFYDVLFVLSLTLGIYLLIFFRSQGKSFSRRDLLFLLPPSIFLIFYLIHLLGVSRPFFVGRTDVSNLFQAANLIQWPGQLLFVSYLWFTEALSPYASKLGLLLGVLGVVGLSPALSKKYFVKHYPFFLLMLCLILSYVGSISFVRLISRGWYYLYFFSTLSAILIYSCFDFSLLRGKKRILALTVLGLVLTKNALITTRRAERMALKYEPMTRYHSNLSRWVDRGKQTKDFSFIVESPKDEFDPWVELKEGYPDDEKAPVKRKRLSEFLYAPYVTPRNPKYVLRWNGNAFEEIASR